MAEIMNNTPRPVTLHNKKWGEYKIHPRDSVTMDNKAWEFFKKNGVVKQLLKRKELIVIEEAPSLLTKIKTLSGKIKNFFY